MKKSTIERIIDNYNKGRNTFIGKFVYSIRWHPMTRKDYIIRCKRGNENREWLDWEGNIVTGWEWMRPIVFEK